MSGDSIEQIDQMRAGIDYRFPVMVRDFQLMVRPLSIVETVRVAQKVAEAMKGIPDSARNRLTEHTYLAKETLVIASTSDVGVNDQRITDLILDRMTPDELSYLFKQYVQVCDRANPALESMSIQDLKDMVEGLKKKAEEEPEELVLLLTELSHFQLLNVATSLLIKGD